MNENNKNQLMLDFNIKAEKKCKKCGDIKLLSKFVKKDEERWDSECKKCRKEEIKDKTRKCNNCKASKPINEYLLIEHPDYTSKKRIYTCKNCIERIRKNKKEGKKTCRICNQDKFLENFYQVKKKLIPNGRSSVCRECFKILRKEKYERYLKKYGKNYVQKNRKRINEKATLYYRKTINKKILYGARVRAKKENLPFNLILKDIIIPEKCPICRINLEVGKNFENGPSLDKIIAKEGYTKGNVQVISRKANTIKSFGSEGEHYEICCYMQENQPYPPEYYI